MEDLCTGCLLPHKELRVLNEEKTLLYLAQLPEDLRLELVSIKFSFCVHCSAIIHRMYRFQQLSTWAMQKLLSYHTNLSLGELSDRPNFSQLNITKEIQINIPSEHVMEQLKKENLSEEDIFDIDNIKAEKQNDIIENEIDIIEDEIRTLENVRQIETVIDEFDDKDYQCDCDSYINDINLNSCNNSGMADSENVAIPKKITKKRHKTIASKKDNNIIVRNKYLTKKDKKKRSENLNMKLETNKKTRKKPTKTLDNDLSDYVNDTELKKYESENDNTTENDDITMENNDTTMQNDDTTIQNDDTTMQNDDTTMQNNDTTMQNDNKTIEIHVPKNNDTTTKANAVKAEIVTILLNRSQIREERKQMTYVSDYALSHFKCKHCIIGFDSIKEYDKHFAEFHHKQLGAHVCDICSRRFAERASLVEHSREHTVRFKCSLCAVTVTNVPAIEAHLSEHSPFVCEQCGLVTGSTLHHQVHLNKVHGLKLQCTQCDKMFSSAKTLRYHLKVLHKGENRYPCPHCGKVYQWKSNLFRHIKNHKAQTTGELFCALCDKHFSSVATYKQHLAISKRHATPQQYSFSCDQCEKRFILKRDLTDHVNWEHLHKTVHVCTQCTKPFKSYMALYLHGNVHKQPADRANLCHLCGKCYPTQSKLKCHLLAKHSDVMPYKCTLCDACFNWYSSLYRHAQKVHGLTKEQYKIKKPKSAEDQLQCVG